MKAQLSSSLKELIAKIRENGKEIVAGPRCSYSLMVPYAEHLGNSTRRFARYLTVRASSFDEAVGFACEKIETSCWDAQLRGDIIGWEIYRGEIRETSSHSSKTGSNTGRKVCYSP